GCPVAPVVGRGGPLPRGMASARGAPSSPGFAVLPGRIRVARLGRGLGTLGVRSLRRLPVAVRDPVRPRAVRGLLGLGALRTTGLRRVRWGCDLYVSLHVLCPELAGCLELRAVLLGEPACLPGGCRCGNARPEARPAETRRVHLPRSG